MKILDGNAFKLRITCEQNVEDYKATTDMSKVESLLVNFVRRGRITQTSGVDSAGRIVASNSGNLAIGIYGVELTGYYNGAPWRFYADDVFEIINDENEVSESVIDEGVPIYDVTFTLSLGGSADISFVDSAIINHNDNEFAHGDIRRKLGDKIDDILVDDESVVETDPVTGRKEVKFDSDNFGKVDDVKVNGTSVVSQKVANIPVPTKTSDLQNDSNFVDESDMQSALDEKQDKIDTVNLDYQEDGGSPSASASFENGELDISMKNMKMKFSELTAEEKESLRGPQGIPGEGAIWTGEGEEIMALEQETGQAINKAMSQKAVTEALINNTADESYKVWTTKTATTSKVWIQDGGNGDVWTSNNKILIKLIPISLFFGAKKVKIVGVPYTRYAYLTSNSTTIGNTPSYCSGHTQCYAIGATTVIEEIPSDCQYIYFDYQYNNGAIRMPEVVAISSTEDKAIKLSSDDEAAKQDLNGIINLVSQMDEGYRATTVGSAVGDLTWLDNYLSLLVTNPRIGDVYKVAGYRGMSGGLWAKVSNNEVTEAGATYGIYEEDTIVVDGTFDSLVFNFEKNHKHSLTVSNNNDSLIGKVGDYHGELVVLDKYDSLDDGYYNNSTKEWNELENYVVYRYKVTPEVMYHISGYSGNSGTSYIWYDSQGSIISMDKLSTGAVFSAKVIAPVNAAMLGVAGHRYWDNHAWQLPEVKATMSISDELNKLRKNTLKILCFGNSFTQDSFCYAPFILNKISKNANVTIGIAYYGGSNLQDHLGFIQNDSASYTYQKYVDGSTGWVSTSSQKASTILADEDWDIVQFQQQSSKSNDYGTYQPYLKNLIKTIAAATTKPVKFGWNLTHAPGAVKAESDTFFEGIVTAVQSMDAATPVQYINPYGTAIQNARSTSLQSLGTGGNLTHDELHLQEGIPALIANYTTVLTLGKLLGMDICIIGETTGKTIDDMWIADHKIPGTNGSCVGISEANCRIAQYCAVMASKNPFVITDCSSYND